MVNYRVIIEFTLESSRLRLRLRLRLLAAEQLYGVWRRRWRKEEACTQRGTMQASRDRAPGSRMLKSRHVRRGCNTAL